MRAIFGHLSLSDLSATAFASIALLLASGSLEARSGQSTVLAESAPEQTPRDTSCAIRLQRFVIDLDRTLDAKPDSVADVDVVLRHHLPVSQCDVDATIAAAKHSKYFTSAYDWGPAYTISFKSPGFQVSFALRKDSGNIELPAARVTCGGKDCP